MAKEVANQEKDQEVVTEEPTAAKKDELLGEAHPYPAVFNNSKPKREKMLLIGIAALGALLFASIGFNIAQAHQKAELPGRAGLRFQDFNSSNGPGGMMGFDGGYRGGHHGASLQTFFNSDGSVNTEKVMNTLSKVTGDSKSELQARIKTKIDAAKASGTITADQAAKLETAFGITSSS